MLYIGTSTQFKFSFVNQNAFEQGAATNRVDATAPNVTILAQKKEEVQMSSIPLGMEEK